MTHQSQQGHSFYGLGIAPSLLETLTKLGYTIPTPIQSKAIPVALQGQDIIGIAQTGTGKTLAFSIPMIQRIAKMKGMGLIILPTRELALQVEETLQKIGRSIGLKTAILIGGAPMHSQIQAVRRGPHIVVGTPGRIIDHLDQKILQLHTVNTLVLDEADRMLDMGFAPQLKKIMDRVPRERQTLLFSATMPDQIVKIATGHMKLPVRVEIARSGTMAEKVEQEIFFIRKDEKNRLLSKILQEYTGTVLIFSRTKHGAKKLRKVIQAMGHGAAEIHSNRSLGQRKEALSGFKSGKYRILVATDIAARGIDVTGIELVVNYDLPDNPEDYVHRIGRTGRAGLAGNAVSFATPEQKRDVKDIERLIRAAIPVSNVPQLPPEPPRPAYEESFFSGGRVMISRARHQGSGQSGNRSQHSHGQPSRPGQSSSHGQDSQGSQGRKFQGGRSRFGRHRRRFGSR